MTVPHGEASGRGAVAVQILGSAVTVDAIPQQIDVVGEPLALLASAIAASAATSLAGILRESEVATAEILVDARVGTAGSAGGLPRLALGEVNVELSVEEAAAWRVARNLQRFEGRCAVIATLRDAFPIVVRVAGPDGQTMYDSRTAMET